MVRAAVRFGGEVRVVRHVVLVDNRFQSLPLRLAANGQGQPLVVAAGAVDAVRRFPAMAVADALRLPRRQRTLRYRVGQQGLDRLGHGEVDALAPAGGGAMTQRLH